MVIIFNSLSIWKKILWVKNTACTIGPKGEALTFWLHVPSVLKAIRGHEQFGLFHTILKGGGSFNVITRTLLSQLPYRACHEISYISKEIILSGRRSRTYSIYWFYWAKPPHTQRVWPVQSTSWGCSLFSFCTIFVCLYICNIISSPFSEQSLWYNIRWPNSRTVSLWWK